MIRCYILPYALGSNEHCIIPVAAATTWDREHKIKEVLVSREELDTLREQMDQWCSYQDRMDSLLQ